MTYVIKNYSEEYLQKQFEIGNSILSSWSGATQTSVENLKQVYSAENFDPETKLYAFKDDEMVGFITATIKPLKEGEENLRANMEFPIVLEGHEAAEDLLYSKAIEVLRSKGVKRVQSRATDLWGETKDKAKIYGYEQKEVLNSNATLNTTEYQSQAGSLG
ncbi:MAG: hypothetical protein GPJ54_02155, partial [Candidatus Heimdallarchaeota archaeon]|nr:hypothetical protein [Candidatus Heimdallarchaeota archaeon]